MQFFFTTRLLLSFLLVLCFALSGCNQKSEPTVTINLKRSDFVERIKSSGTIQAVNVISISAPRVNASTMTVIFLAKNGSFVKKGDTVCILSANDLLTIRESFRSMNETAMADLQKLEATNALDMSVLEAKVETNKAQLEISMLDSVQKKFAPPVKQQLIALELEKSQIEQNKLLKQLGAMKKIDASELASLRSRIKMNENRMQMFTDQIKSLTLLSPADGLAMHVESPILMFMSSQGMGTLGGKIEEGSSVWSNMGLLQIPDLKEMQVTVEVAEADYKRIEKGQRVDIQIDAANNLFTTGKVKRKNLVGKQNQKQSAVKTYEVIVSVDSCHSKMTPGMSASCDFLINEIKDTIVVPTIAVFEKDSSKYIYVASEDKFIAVNIETGPANSTETIVSKGLSGNETISLMEPSHKMIKKSTGNLRDTLRLIPPVTDTLALNNASLKK